ncbi:ureidoglycolate lyase [Neptunomonas sp.]|uniref:ureidoglycolate lyase n=1 Tax=Neptunomonas sp. TaxID=1971898 RepID=UPI003563F5C0
MIKLKIETLTTAAFSEFGDVIETQGRDHFMINNGSTQRFHRLAEVDVLGESAKAIISIFRAKQLPMPHRVMMLERHPLGSQAFIPLKGHPFLIIVAPKGEDIDPQEIRAFISNGQQGVNYHTGTWHHPILTAVAEDDFLVVDRAGEGNNCDEHFFSDEISIILDPSE